MLHLSAEPSVMVYNKSVNKVLKEGFKGERFYKSYWTCRMLILAPNAHNNVMIYQKLVHTLPDAKAYIADFLVVAWIWSTVIFPARMKQPF